ncbi:MAG TPA: hypothetical protein VFN23_12155 [Ktedonobacteraceae bacterium]|nr:hypothetical protein [Ktedonobacteraceae bacterium]
MENRSDNGDASSFSALLMLTEDHRVSLSNIGTLKVKFPKGKRANPLQGSMKTCNLKREGEYWFVVFTCEVQQEVIYHPSKDAVGIDLGLRHLPTQLLAITT